MISHRIALDITFKQRAYFARAAGCDRFCWNLALEEWNRRYAASEKCSAMEIKKDFNTFKYEAFPWMKEVGRDAHADAFERVAKAWTKHFKNLEKTGRPKFRKKGRRDSFYVSNDRISFRDDGWIVSLPVIGEVRMREKLRYRGKILKAVVSRIADRWFISINIDATHVLKKGSWVAMEAATKRSPETLRAGGIVGCDLGIKKALTVSDGQSFDAPRPLKKAMRKIKRLSRKASRQAKGGKNQRKTYQKVARVHTRCVNIRKDHWDKITTKLCRENQAVGVETLNVKGMLQNRKLARALSDVAFGEFLRQMEYKSRLYGTALVKADRFYPSSKTCSQCGHVKECLPLSERVFHCDHCGFMADRDLNASIELMHLAFASQIKPDELAQEKLPTACGKVKPAKEERPVRSLSAAGTKKRRVVAVKLESRPQ